MAYPDYLVAVWDHLDLLGVVFGMVVFIHTARERCYSRRCKVSMSLGVVVAGLLFVLKLINVEIVSVTERVGDMVFWLLIGGIVVLFVLLPLNWRELRETR